MAIHVRILAWRIPWMEELWGCKELDTTEWLTHVHTGSPLQLSWQRIHRKTGDPGVIPGSGRSDGERIGYPLQYFGVSLMAQPVKNLPAMQKTWAQSLGWEDPLEKGMAITPVFWPEDFHGLYSSWGHKELDMTDRLSLHHAHY